MTALPLARHVHSLEALGPWGTALLAVGCLASLWVIWKAVVYTLRPGEEAPDHIKRSILDEEGGT